MNTKKILCTVLASLTLAVAAHAQQTDERAMRTDSVTIRMKIRQLTGKQEQLSQRIAAEDKLRNQTIAGVSVENMEAMNLRQDSLCLALRSELVDVNLELAEQQAALAALVPATPAPATDGQAPATPQQPSKVQQAMQALKNRPTKK